ncbi:hypothetical protein B0H63DRAFT_519403 [Podospora didyma]|uniref:LysM domain-containing protein n=1 Tax=Podospora didyma TaxID=330526 RepID=A0AAE0NYJ9_9PEZI|nr:hypothetical protein B0H63DRAFT_519403 [Podospora didyma]
MSLLSNPGRWLLPLLCLRFPQTALAIQLLSATTAPDNVSSGCLSALTADVPCGPLVPEFRTGYYYDEAMLNSSCTTQCEAALATYETSIVSACSGDTWSGYDDEGGASLALIPSIMRYQYSLACLQDSGRWCNVVAGIAARIADPGDSRGRFTQDVTGNGTAPSPCDLCFVKGLRIQAGVPYFDGPAIVSMSVYESKTSSCNVVNMPRTTSTIPVIITSVPVPTQPPCAGTTYTIQTGDTCHSVSLSQGIGTAWLLMDNRLPAWCDKFPTTGTLCLENKCNVVTVQTNGTCHGIAKAAGITEAQLKAWNVVINAGCYNIEKMVGYQLCISPPGDAYVDPIPPAPVTTPAPLPTDMAEGTNPRCARYYQVQPDEFCNLVVMRFGISLEDFYFLNQGLNSNCTNLFAFESYCVGAFGDIDTYVGRPGSRPTQTESIPFATLTPIASATTTRPIINTPIPLPLAAGTADDCVRYFNGSDFQDASVITGTRWANQCQYAAALFSVSNTDLALWNPSLPNITTSSCVFSSTLQYCGRRYDGNPPDDPVNLGLEFPIRAGAIAACSEYGDVPSDWTCADVLHNFDLSRAQLFEYNPAVGADCSALQTAMAYCIRGPNYSPPAVSSSAPPSSTTSSPGPPGPTHTGQPANCNLWHKVSSGDTCSTVATLYGLTLAQFLALNPAVSSDCSINFWLDQAYCVGTSATSQPPTTTTTTTPSGPPGPTHTGQPSNCNAWRLVQSGDTCSSVASGAGISLSQFLAWNPAVSSDCSTNFWLGQAYCVGVSSSTTATSSTSRPLTSTAATSSTPASPPGPTHTGQPSNCNAWHLVQSGNTCTSVASSHGITLAQFLAWNPAVSADCTANFWLGQAYCVGVAPVVVPEPVQAGNAVAACARYAQAQAGDWCSAFAARNGITDAQLVPIHIQLQPSNFEKNRRRETHRPTKQAPISAIIITMGGGPVTPGELRDILTPSLFSHIVKHRLPYAKDKPINFSHFGRDIFLQNRVGPLVKEQAWPALIALSKIGLDHMPDLSTYLPAPSDPTYPEQVLGLQLLLDHCTRVLFRGVDHRYTNAYFNVLSERLAKTWLSLPADQRPDSWERWHHDLGADLDYWIGVRFWFGTPFVHSELLANQEIALAYTEETRSVVERVSGQTDPYRASRDAILADLHGFPREYRKGPPQGDDVTRESWTFWMGMLMDIHKPIIDRFGRYPSRNAITGRESTAEELTWIEDTGSFGQANEETARKIKEDVKLGRWRPLGEGSEVTATTTTSS